MAAGLSEIVGSTFIDGPHVAVLPVPAEPIALVNPLSQDAALLRHHPLAGVLGAVALNVRRQHSGVRLFEIGRTYERRDGATAEPRWATLALSGARGEPAWYRPLEPVDVYDAKGLAEHALRAVGVTVSIGPRGALSGFEPDCHGTLVADGTVLAEFGEIAEPVRTAFDIDAPVFAAVLSLDALASRPPGGIRYEALPRFPAVQRDVAFVIAAGADVTAATIESAMREQAGTLLRGLTLFDVFRFPDGRRSVAWRLTFQADDRTLTDEEINAIQGRVAREVSQRFHITWRGSDERRIRRTTDSWKMPFVAPPRRWGGCARTTTGCEREVARLDDERRQILSGRRVLQEIAKLESTIPASCSGPVEASAMADVTGSSCSLGDRAHRPHGGRSRVRPTPVRHLEERWPRCRRGRPTTHGPDAGRARRHRRAVPRA